MSWLINCASHCHFGCIKTVLVTTHVDYSFSSLFFFPSFSSSSSLIIMLEVWEISGTSIEHIGIDSTMLGLLAPVSCCSAMGVLSLDPEIWVVTEEDWDILSVEFSMKWALVFPAMAESALLVLDWGCITLCPWAFDVSCRESWLWELDEPLGEIGLWILSSGRVSSRAAHVFKLVTADADIFFGGLVGDFCDVVKTMAC